MEVEVETLCSHCRLRQVHRQRGQIRAAVATVRQTVSPERIDTLLSGITDLRDRALFSLLVATGLRAGEVQQLDRNSIQTEQHRDESGSIRSIGVGRLTATKSGRKRTFFLDEVALVDLQKYLESREDRMDALFLSRSNRRMDSTAIRTRLSYWCAQTGIPQIRSHQLRHTFAMAMAKAAINSLVIAELLGFAYRGPIVAQAEPSLQTLAAAYLSAIELLRQR